MLVYGGRKNIFLIFRSVTPQQWEDFSRYNKDRAEAEMEASRRLREAIHHTLQQTDNDLKAQQTNSDYAIRKRMHEMKRAIDELNWQKAQVHIVNSIIQKCKNKKIDQAIINNPQTL